jgi:hypothetical protein
LFFLGRATSAFGVGSIPLVLEFDLVEEVDVGRGISSFDSFATDVAAAVVVGGGGAATSVAGVELRLVTRFKNPLIRKIEER